MQEDTNKYLDQLTKLISESTKAPVKGVSKPAWFSGNSDKDFSLWLDHFKAIASLGKTCLRQTAACFPYGASVMSLPRSPCGFL